MACWKPARDKSKERKGWSTEDNRLIQNALQERVKVKAKECCRVLSSDATFKSCEAYLHVMNSGRPVYTSWHYELEYGADCNDTQCRETDR